MTTGTVVILQLLGLLTVATALTGAVWGASLVRRPRPGRFGPVTTVFAAFGLLMLWVVTDVMATGS